MDVKKLVLGMVGIMICAVMIGGALLPSITGALNDEIRVDNRTTSYYDMEEITTDINYIFEWAAVNDNNATINGETVGLSQGILICKTEQFVIRFGLDSDYYLQSVSVPDELPYLMVKDGAEHNEIRIEIENGIMTVTKSLNGQNTITNELAVDNGYVIVPRGTGDYVIKNNSPAYVFGDTPLLFMGVSSINGVWDVGYFIEGTINDGVTISYWNKTGYEATDIVINAERVVGFDNLYKLNNVTANISAPDNYTTTATYSSFIIPDEIVDYKTNSGLTPAISALFNAIPIVAIAGLVMAGIYVFISRK